MSWKKCRYPNHLILTGWQRSKEVPDLMAIVNKYYPGVCLDRNDDIVQWKEKGRTYITWCGDETSSIKNYACLVKASNIQWFKKDSI
jgi:hypothetical protein